MGAENLADLAIRFREEGAAQVERAMDRVGAKGVQTQEALTKTATSAVEALKTQVRALEREFDSRVAQIQQKVNDRLISRADGERAAQQYARGFNQELSRALRASPLAGTAQGASVVSGALAASGTRFIASDTSVRALSQGLGSVAREATTANRALKGTSETTQSLIFAFNGLAGSAVGLPQTFGTLAGRLAPFVIGGQLTAALLIGITALGAAWDAFGGKAKKAAKDAEEAQARARAALDDLQNAGDVAGLQGRARTLFEGTASTGFRNGLRSLNQELASEQARFDQAARQNDLATFLNARKRLAELRARIAPIQAEFDDIRRRILAPGPSLVLPREPITVTANRNRPPTRGEIARAERDAQNDALYQGAIRGLGTIQSVGRDFSGASPIRGLTAGRAGDSPLAGLVSPETLRMAELRETVAGGLSDALVGGITGGIERAIASGSIGEGFAALTGALLGGLGDAAIKFGLGSQAVSKLMGSITSKLASLLPGGALTASIALVAAGAALKGLAGRAFGGSRGGGSGMGALGGFGGGGVGGTTERIDSGVIAGAFGSGVATPPAGGFAQARPVIVQQFGLLNPADPASQRVIDDARRAGVERGFGRAA
jgi:hypothetical protein